MASELELRQKIVDLAVSYNGVSLGSATHKEIIDCYNANTPLPRSYSVTYTDSWCATFVSAMAIKLGLSDIIPQECSCGQQVALFKALDRWVEDDSYTPGVGDIIYYYWSDDGVGDTTGWPNHVGIVASVSGSTIKVIEGNISNAVGYRSMAVDGRYIRGYGVPDYASKVVADEEKEGGEEMTKEAIKEYVTELLIEFLALKETEEDAKAGEVSSWAESSWAKATALKVFDGTSPGNPLTREQCAVVLDRLGLLK